MNKIKKNLINLSFSRNKKLTLKCFIPRILPNSKKASHVGIILSFMIFILFLMFLFSILQPPIKMQKEKTFILKQFETELIKNCSDEIISMSIYLDEIPIETCFYFDNTTFIYSNIVTKNETGEVINSSFKDGKINIKTKNRFYKIFSSKSFEANNELNSCGLLTTENYTIGLIKKDNYVFEKKIIELIKDYNEGNYVKMKNDFKIPQGNDFDFSFTYNNDTTVGNRDLNLSTNVYTKKVYVQYVDKNANILSGIINLKIW